MKRFLPFILYAAVIIVVFWGVLWPPEGTILFGPDISRYHYWQRQLLGTALGEGQIPWWNPFIMMGVPYLEHPQIPIWYLPNLLFVLLPTNVAISWYIALHLFIAMTGMYCAIGAMLNATCKMPNEKQAFRIQHSSFSITVSSWSAGLAFGLSAYFVARIPAGHIDIIAASSWMPFVISAFMRLMRAEVVVPSSASRRQGPDRSILHQSFFAKAMTTLETSRLPARSIALTGIILAIQLLSGHPMVAVFTLEAVFIVSLCQWVSVRSVKPFIAIGISVLFGLALSAIQIFPNAQFIASSIRTFPFPDSWAHLGTPTVGHLLEFLDPFYFYARLPDSGFGFEHVGYMGKIPIVFGMIAIISWILMKKNRRWEIPAFILVGLFGIWMWLGANAPIDLFSWVRSWLPLYSQIRIPARHVILMVLSLGVLFGVGLNLVKSKALQIIVVVVLLVELVPFARRHLTLVPVPERSEDPELVSILTRDQSLYRFLPNFYQGEPLREALEFNAPISHRIQSVSGYDTPPLRNMYEFLLAVGGFQFSEVLSYSESTPPFRNINSPYLNYLNIKYILVPIAGDTIKDIRTGQFVLIKENTSRGWRLYENKTVNPRFFIATQMQKEPNRVAVLSAIERGSVDPKTTIIVDASTVDTTRFSSDCSAFYQGKVNVTSYGYGRIALTSDNPCNAFLATSEVMYPSWTATIDGERVPVFESNAAFRTVYLPKGPHTIVFSYRPMIVLLGAAVSIVAIGITRFLFRSESR